MPEVEVDVDPLVRLASALTDRPADLVAEVRRAAGPRLQQIEESPAELRRIVVRTFLAGRGREKTAGPRWELTDTQPAEFDRNRDPHGPAELDRVSAAFHRLPRLDRAVLVLVHLEQLTRAEAVGILDRPGSMIDAILDEVPAQLHTSTDILSAALRSRAQQWVDPGEIRRAEVGLVTVGRRRKRRRGAVLVGAGLLVVGLLVVPGALRPRMTDLQIRNPGVWALSTRFDPPQGWTVTTQTISVNLETTHLQGPAPESGSCTVRVDHIDPLSGSRIPNGSEVKVQGRSGWLQGGLGQADLAWPVQSGLAEVECSGFPGAGSFVLSLAERITFELQPILLPYRLPGLPAHLHVDSVTIEPPRGASMVQVTSDESAEDAVVPIEIHSEGSINPLRPTGLDAPKPTGWAQCRLLDPMLVCVRLLNSAPSYSSYSQTVGNRRMSVIADTMVVAGGGDHSRWFDARDALPRG